MDLVTGQGIADALRDAELLAHAVAAGLDDAGRSRKGPEANEPRCVQTRRTPRKGRRGASVGEPLQVSELGRAPLGRLAQYDGHLRSLVDPQGEDVRSRVMADDIEVVLA